MIALVLLVGCGAGGAPPVENPGIINELLAVDRTGAVDEAGELADWIELRDPTGEGLDLSGWSLYVDLDGGQAPWVLPAEAVVPAGGYALVWCDGEPTEGPLHAPFTLDHDRGDLVLLDPDGDLADEARYGLMREDTSWGRVPDGSDDWRYLVVPTPGASNGG